MARQYLGSVGKVDNSIVAATKLWADKERYYPLHVMPYTPDKRLSREKHDPAFCATVADCFYGADRALEKALLDRRLPHVLERIHPDPQ